MLVTTPCVLMLLDYWPLARFDGKRESEMPNVTWLILEKLPLLCLSALASLLALEYQHSAIVNNTLLPFSARIASSALTYVVYVGQTFWPFELSPLYVYRRASLITCSLALLGLVSFTTIAVALRKNYPYLVVGWLWYLGMSVPIIGLVQVGSQAHADRYMYLPQIGLFLIVVWYGCQLASRSRLCAYLLSSAMATFLIGFVILTEKQIVVWRDTETLWTHACQLDRDNTVAVYYLSKFYLDEGRNSDAVKAAHEAIRLSKTFQMRTLQELAIRLADSGEFETCVEVLNEILAIVPNAADVLTNRGKAFSAMGKWQNAVDDYRQAMRISPNTPSLRFYLGHALHKSGELDEARRMFAIALQQSPDWPVKAAKDAWRMSTSPELGERTHFWPICLAEQANLSTGETHPDFLNVLAAAYANSGRFDDAIATAKQAIEQAERAGQSAAANHMRERLEIYQQHRPFRFDANLEKSPAKSQAASRPR